ncbi:hypothetical protein NL676_002411 [Syzygium grande]|nr:hypothetical protein NL676_002411 [Syzygium grande]
MELRRSRTGLLAPSPNFFLLLVLLLSVRDFDSANKTIRNADRRAHARSGFYTVVGGLATGNRWPQVHRLGDRPRAGDTCAAESRGIDLARSLRSVAGGPSALTCESP